jgi:voltage-gated potassium channel Kch
MEYHWGLPLIDDLMFTFILISAVYAVSDRKQSLIISVTLVIPIVVLVWLAFILKQMVFLISAKLLGLLFISYAILTIIRYVFHQSTVTGGVISASIVAYLLIGMFWADLYALLEWYQPGSFDFESMPDATKRYRYIYFSLVTLTTLGYGDISPLRDEAGSLAVLEAVIGQVFMTVLVARLVGMHISHSQQSK